MALANYRRVYVADFEYRTIPRGNPPVVLCVGVIEIRTGQRWSKWVDEFTSPLIPDFDDKHDLFVAWAAEAEMACYLVLGEPLPTHVLDLYAEYRCLTNGKRKKRTVRNRLQDAMAELGLQDSRTLDKEAMQQLLAKGGPFTDQQKQDALAYVLEDVDDTKQVALKLAPYISNWSQALFRGNVAKSAAKCQITGIHIDEPLRSRLDDAWPYIRSSIITDVNQRYRVFRPTTHTKLNGKAGKLIQVADDHNHCPYLVAAIAQQVWESPQYENAREFEVALAAARKTLKLTPAKIDKLLDNGKDHSHVKGMDVVARELAAEYPILGLQPYGLEYDGTDNAERLFDLLCQHREPLHALSAELAEEAVGLLDNNAFDLSRISYSFSEQAFSELVERRNVTWPRTKTGRLSTSKETFRQMEKSHAWVAPLYQVLSQIDKLKLFESLAVGSDSRNRTLMAPYGSITGRNQPSNKENILGMTAALRSLIIAPLGKVLLYSDWRAQEPSIMASLSGDPNMLHDYLSGDFYLNFGARIGAVPVGATKETHGEIRDALKVACGLGAAYGASEYTVAAQAGVPVRIARNWLRSHRVVYATYWKFVNGRKDAAQTKRKLVAKLGWTAWHPYVNGKGESKTLTAANFPMQANGSEMLRLAMVKSHELGLTVCAPLHDAILYEVDEHQVDESKQLIEQAMGEAATLITGIKVDVEHEEIRERFTDKRGKEFWELLMRRLNEFENPVPF